MGGGEDGERSLGPSSPLEMIPMVNRLEGPDETLPSLPDPPSATAPWRHWRYVGDGRRGCGHFYGPQPAGEECIWAGEGLGHVYLSFEHRMHSCAGLIPFFPDGNVLGARPPGCDEGSVGPLESAFLSSAPVPSACIASTSPPPYEFKCPSPTPPHSHPGGDKRWSAPLRDSGRCGAVGPWGALHVEGLHDL